MILFGRGGCHVFSLFWALAVLFVAANANIEVHRRVRRQTTSKMPATDKAPVRHSHNRQQQLVRRLFNNYVKEAMPESPVVVHFDLLLLKLKQSVEKEGIFESVVALFVEWRDKRMSWEPRLYDNLTLLTFDADQLWLPDIAMTNSADHLYAISRDNRFVVRVSHDGMFKFVPTGTARTWCDFTLLTFPFDFQTCTMEFESWSMNASVMTFDGHSHLLLDSQFSSTEWSLCQYRAFTYDHTYQFTNETFTRVLFEYIVKRKSTFYVINLIFPVSFAGNVILRWVLYIWELVACAILSLIQLLLFWISSTDTTVDRIGFGTTNLLTLVVFQTIVTAEMPKTSDAVTALSKYIIALITISTVGILESVMVERMLSTVLQPPPQIMMRMLKFIPILWREKPDPINHQYKKPISFENEMMMRSDNSSNDYTGSRIATSMSRRNNIAYGSLGRRMSFSLHRSPLCNLANSFSRESLQDDLSIDEGKLTVPHPPDHLIPIIIAPPTSPISSAIRKASIESGLSFGPSKSSNMLSNSQKPGMRHHISRIVSFTQPAAEDQPAEKDEQQQVVSISEHSATATEARNALMWTEVAYRIDFITFVTCASLAFGIPCSLFLPLAYVTESCSDTAKGFETDYTDLVD